MEYLFDSIKVARGVLVPLQLAANTLDAEQRGGGEIDRPVHG